MAIALLALLLLVGFVLYRNCQLEKRWRAARYCWHTMSDFAARVGEQDSASRAKWEAVVNEQSRFLHGFGAPVLTDAEIQLYEAALFGFSHTPLTAHR